MANGNGTHAGTRGAERPRARGRQEADKQEAVTKPKVIAEKINELVKLKVKADDAATDLNDAIKKAAEESGYNASTVRKFVVARAGEDFEKKHREVEQQYELFDEVGE